MRVLRLRGSSMASPNCKVMNWRNGELLNIYRRNNDRVATTLQRCSFAKEVLAWKIGHYSQDLVRDFELRQGGKLTIEQLHPKYVRNTSFFFV